MKISDYQSGLPVTLKRVDLLEDTDNATALFNTLFKLAKSLNKSPTTAVQSPQLQRIAYAAKAGLQTTPFQYVISNRKNIVENLRTLESAVNELPAEMVSKTLTIDTIGILALVDAAVSSSTWVLNFRLEVAKTEYLNGKSEELVGEIASNRSNLRVMNTLVGKFIWGIRLLASKPAQFKEKLEGTQAVFLTESSEAVAKATGSLKSHPLSASGTDGFIGNPFFAIGSYLVSWRANTYKLVEEEVSQLELILLATEAEAKGGASPALEKKIALLNQRIKEKRIMLKEIEE
jgi:hypothetical protein